MRPNRTLSLAIVVSILMQSLQVVRGQSQQDAAQHFVSSTWSEADSMARMLVARDLFESFQTISGQLKESSLADQQAQDLPALKADLINTLKEASGEDVHEVERAEGRLEHILDAYRSVVATRYRLSWYSTNSLIDSNVLANTAALMVDQMKSRCEQGSSVHGDDFYTVPRPSLPRLDFTVSVGATFHEGTGQVGITANASSSKSDSTRGAIAAICVSGASLACGPICGVAAGLVVAAIYGIIDWNDSAEEKADIARAEAYRLNARAVSSDVNTLYKKHCGYAVRTLEETKAVLNMTGPERSDFIASTTTPEFASVIKGYQAEQEREQTARCRASAVTFAKASTCAPAGTPPAQPVFDVHSTCSAAPGSSVQCPQRVISVDNGCRESSDGTLKMYLVEGVQTADTYRVQLDDKPACEVKPPYNVSAEVATLRQLAAIRSTDAYMDTYSKNVGRWLAAGIAKTVTDSSEFQKTFTLGEEELDRQQQYALQNIMRLIYFVRARRQLMVALSNGGKGGYPKDVQTALGAVVVASSHELDPLRTNTSILEMTQATDSLERSLEAVAGEYDINSPAIRSVRVASRQLQILNQ